MTTSNQVQRYGCPAWYFVGLGPLPVVHGVEGAGRSENSAIAAIPVAFTICEVLKRLS